ncbi:hypothetical protein JX266_008707 [Neoarthrinium moseri]|nr:hypothetical protein JX266_008707 [Neoarthrinium moseri]
MDSVAFGTIVGCRVETRPFCRPFFAAHCSLLWRRGSGTPPRVDRDGALIGCLQEMLPKTASVTGSPQGHCWPPAALALLPTLKRSRYLDQEGRSLEIASLGEAAGPAEHGKTGVVVPPCRTDLVTVTHEHVTAGLRPYYDPIGSNKRLLNALATGDIRMAVGEIYRWLTSLPQDFELLQPRENCFPNPGYPAV